MVSVGIQRIRPKADLVFIRDAIAIAVNPLLRGFLERRRIGDPIHNQPVEKCGGIETGGYQVQAVSDGKD